MLHPLTPRNCTNWEGAFIVSLSLLAEHAALYVRKRLEYIVTWYGATFPGDYKDCIQEISKASNSYNTRCCSVYIRIRGLKVMENMFLIIFPSKEAGHQRVRRRTVHPMTSTVG